jgi:hypothetical protein
VHGIMQKIWSKKFEFAERKIFDIDDEKTRSALYDFLYFQWALDSVTNKDWSIFDKCVGKISGPLLKGFLYLRALVVVDQKNLAEYVLEAEKHIGNISDKKSRAVASVSLASALSSRPDGARYADVPNTLARLNEAPDYWLDELQLLFFVPPNTTISSDVLDRDTFVKLFRKLALTNWIQAQVQALQLKDDSLTAIAQVTAAKAVLDIKTQQKATPTETVSR